MMMMMIMMMIQHSSFMMSTVYNALRRDSSLVLTHAVLFGSLQHRAPKTSHGTFGSKCFAFFEYTYLQVNHLVRHSWRILSCVLELKHFARFVQSRSCNGKKLLLSFLFVFLNSGANPLLSTAVAVHWRATSAYVPKWRWSRPADFYMIPLCSEVEISPPPPPSREMKNWPIPPLLLISEGRR